MGTRRKDTIGPAEPRDEFDKLDGGDDAQPEDEGEYFAGYRRRRVVFVIDHENTEEEHAERQRVLMNPVNLEELIAAHIEGNIIEIDGKIVLDFPPLVIGLEKCGITAEELFALRPDLAVQNTDNKGKPI